MGVIEKSTGPLDWDSHVSDMTTSCHVKDAAIYDLDGKLLTTTSEEFSLTTEEFTTLKEHFHTPSVLTRSGVSVNGQLYRVHLADGHFGLMAKSGLPASGCSICKTTKLFVVGVHSPGMDPEVCNQVVMEQGDFFISKGF